MRKYEFHERPGLEEALGEAHAKQVRRLLDRAIRSSANGVLITDAHSPDNAIVYVNPAFEAATGYSKAEALGRNCRFLQADDRDQPALDELREAIREGKECRVVLRNYKKDGTLFYNELSVSPVRDEYGRIVNFIGVQDDVTERKRIEQELEKSEERLRLAAESTGLGTWDYDPVTGVLRWDERCKEIFGLPADAEVDYDAFLAMLHPDDRENVDQVVGLALDPANGGEFATEYRTVLPDGTVRWAAASGRTIFERGRAVRFIGTILDVTGRKGDDDERERLLAREKAAREEAESARRRLALQARAGTVLSASLDYEATLSRVARLTIPEFADFCLVDVLGEDGSLRQLAAAHADPAEEDALRELGTLRALDAGSLEEGSRRVSASVLRSEEAVSLSEEDLLDDASLDEAHRALIRRLHPRACICAPLVARGRSLGTITFVRNKPGSRYDPEDLSLAESLAARCASAIDNARLYASQTRVARALQGSLLPTYIPEVRGFEVGLLYLPAGEANIGGDFYDLFETSERWEEEPGEDGSPPSSWGVVVGDVSGKGPEAAAVLALARYTIRAAAMHRTRPSSVLADLNEAMRRHGRERERGKFCTVAYARLEPDDHGAKIFVSRGGHPAPMLLRPDGEVRGIGYAGRAMGVFADPRLTEQEARLEPGDALVFFTDGVTEARAPDGTFFGEDRLADLLRSSAGLDAKALTNHIGEVVCDFQEEDLHDDIAILVLRAT